MRAGGGDYRLPCIPSINSCTLLPHSSHSILLKPCLVYYLQTNPDSSHSSPSPCCPPSQSHHRPPPDYCNSPLTIPHTCTPTGTSNLLYTQYIQCCLKVITTETMKLSCLKFLPSLPPPVAFHGTSDEMASSRLA